ncbi:CLL_collapsed_G0048980.mRNA.1.CDS.1 [Saccharomyces cerevisiae]|uniref:S-adenosylmethionine decarboxylase proenzyme n=1 Tax=Saccharomyces cerevisiae (strain Kyokai no. 7 / NBRC 101557) TaxID=721032 RepID=G2WMI3_YEASK|nr:Spe2p [Saccharomyces cerevisiae YJM1388]AJU01690.1 Spe2p [Saccharomyces cerevisiae YJM1389]AJU03157.1 Spe2p [Saccharomyces cerevisiae YJM1401]AJU09503.1 Spe2p [Saccharomyces cerevisiae YJM1460]AJU14407.1 Spe2p [Saccharomyces cerevisiae YJM1592]CAI4753403.1 CLN_G0048890.mRNA.1.CDS.1 [Saccharomyces cerevisiae]GAA26276.1 K7_Spe2p [Saccharomyces cerevisiae Kyokai no. 7]
MTVTIKELTNHNYIDHELSATLDSTDAFEGPEKLLEIWFFPHKKSITTKETLRNIGMDRWIEILKLVKCEVLSMKKTKELDAFLLSESSLFVFDHKLTMKTCGTTTTLFCLEKLFQIVEQELSWAFRTTQGGKYKPFKVFYSRRCFLFPCKQAAIHQNWADEVDYLNKFFDNGKSYSVGRNDKSNHWNLYVTETDRSTPKGKEYIEDDDETFEVLMTELDPECASKFVCGPEASTIALVEPNEDKGHNLGYQMTKNTRLDEIYVNSAQDSDLSFHHDAFAFTPCGYSSNMILAEKYYYTLHVTPEKGWSYASFESNIPVFDISQGKQDNLDVLLHILNVFQPREFSMTFFTKNYQNQSFQKLLSINESLPDYIKLDKIVYDLDDYHLFYMKLQRKI